MYELIHLDQDKQMNHYLYHWFVDNLLHLMDWEKLSRQREINYFNQLILTFPNPVAIPLLNVDVKDPNAEWPDGTKFDRTKLNVELVWEVARR